jgi:hypothetical protein
MVAPNKMSVNKSKKEGQHDVEFAEGGDTPMFGEQAAEPQIKAQTSQENTKGPGAKFAEGGSGKMFGFNPAQPAKAGITSAR